MIFLFLRAQQKPFYCFFMAFILRPLRSFWKLLRNATEPLLLLFFLNQYCTWLTWGQTSAFCKSFLFFLPLSHLLRMAVHSKRVKLHNLCACPPPHPSGVSVVWSHCSAPHCLNTSSVPCSLIHVIMIPVSLLVLKLEALPPFQRTPLTVSVCTCVCACVFFACVWTLVSKLQHTLLHGAAMDQSLVRMNFHLISLSVILLYLFPAQYILLERKIRWGY